MEIEFNSTVLWVRSPIFFGKNNLENDEIQSRNGSNWYCSYVVRQRQYRKSFEYWPIQAVEQNIIRGPLGNQIVKNSYVSADSV